MIIVTGTSGFIGSAIVWELNQKGFNDIICVDPIMPREHPGLLDKRNYSQHLHKDQLWDYLKSAKNITHVIHMGACSSTTELNREFLKENNTDYTRRLFEWCTEHQVPFIYASSGAVYGDGTKGFDDQTDPSEFQPLNPYGESKWVFDIWALQQKKTPPLWMGLRFFNVYGPNEYYKKDMSSVIFKAYRQITVEKKLKLFRSHNPNYRDGEQLRDFVYVKDITHWIGQIVSEQKGFSGVYNMGYGQARSWLDLAKAVFNELQLPLNIEWVDIPVEMRPRYQYYTRAKMDRLLSQGFTTPQWSLEKGVHDYVKYLENKDPFF